MKRIEMAVALMSIPVAAQTRLLFVGSASVLGAFQAYQFPGYWSAGINIQ